jgi:PAS domain S-box-containing protein
MRGEKFNPGLAASVPGSKNDTPAAEAGGELERCREILENLPALICRFQPDGTLTYVNRAYREFFGGVGPLVGRNFLDFVPASRHKDVKAHFTALAPQAPTVTYEHPVVSPTGATAWQEWTDRAVFDPFGKLIEFHSIGRDITQRKQTEEDLRQSEERFKQMAESAREVFWLFDCKARKVIYASPAYEKIWGRPVGRLYERYDEWERSIHPQDLASAGESFTRVVETGGGEPREYRIVRPDGSVRWISDPAFAIRNPEGEIYRIAGVAGDITDRKQVEEALRKSEKDYRRVVENAHDAIFIAQGGRIPFANRKARQMGKSLGLDPQQSSYADFIFPEDRDMVAARHQRRLRGEKMPTIYSFRLQGKQGTRIWVELNSVLVDWQGAPATLNFLRDITEQKRLESQFHEAQKMEAVGNLAGGIAHDFNNLLMCIQGNTAVLVHELGTDHPQIELLADIQRSVENGAHLTRQLLGFARRGRYEYRTIDINALLLNTGAMFSRTKREIKIHYQLAENVWAVDVDAGQIEQVLLNLCVNSWQAMPRGGRITLETCNLAFDKNDPQRPAVAPGKYVRISVADEGEGIDAEVLPKIFDPFFTTKEPGKGTGLGLAAAYGIIRNHGGIIEVGSTKNAGTTFQIYLPSPGKALPGEPESGLAPSEPETVFHSPAAPAPTTVLVADDDRNILEIVTRMLTQEGIRVLSALSGREAVAVFRTAAEPIDAVLLDMVMPEMGGFEAFNRIREINPHSRFILSSGYSISEEVAELLARGGVGFLQKPYDHVQLMQKLWRMLGRE